MSEDSEAHFLDYTASAEPDEHRLMRMRSRARRIARKACTWDREKLVHRYARALVTALELQRICRIHVRMAETHLALDDSLGSKIEAQSDALRRAMASWGRDLAKNHFDRAKGIEIKLARDPKHAAIAKVRKEWQNWHERRARYKSGADFARQMIAAYPVLVSTKNIEKLVTKWRRDAERRNRN